MQRHMNNIGTVIPVASLHLMLCPVPHAEKCQRFQFENPFTCMVAGMTGSGGQDCLGPIAVETALQND